MAQKCVVTLPSYWAPALINGDFSGMEPAEIEQMNRTLAPYDAEGWHVVSDVEDSERFTWHYRLYNPYADCEGGNVTDYIMLKIGG